MYCPSESGVYTKYWEPIAEEVNGPLVSVEPSGFVMVTMKPWNTSEAVGGIGSSHIFTTVYSPIEIGLGFKDRYA